jgi:hypothetical protein
MWLTVPWTAPKILPAQVLFNLPNLPAKYPLNGIDLTN